MQNKIAKILFSTRLTAILFIVFALAMGIGTFLDAGQDTSPTPYSRTLIYNTWWFEAIMVFFAINFFGNMFKYRLFRWKKWATLLLHLSFIFIFIGAFITRYIGYEGMMPIREGATENTMLSQKTYISGFINGDYEINGVPQRLRFEKHVDFSPRLDNEFHFETKYDGQPVTISMEKYVGGAELDIVPDESGEEYLKLVEAGNGDPHNHFIKVGTIENVHNLLIALNKPTEGAVNLTYKDGEITIDSPFEGEYLQMASMNTGKLVKDSIQPLMLRSRYIIGDMQMVFPNPVIKGVFDIKERSKLLKSPSENGIVLNITTNGETKRVNVLGGSGTNNGYTNVEVGGLDLDIKYGAKVIELPFSIKLNDFIAERYPGTENSYSSFASQVTVIDEQEGDFDYKIYMNHILDHRGYRFFQAQFDPDEKGTILSVNHDYWGTWFTYLGYFLLYIGLMAILFDKNTRFKDLEKALNKIKKKKAETLTVLLLMLSVSGFAQEDHSGHDHANEAQTTSEQHQVEEANIEDVKQVEEASHTSEEDHVKVRATKAQIDSVLRANIVPKEHAELFGHMVIQDLGGRMMPLNTYASELLRKVSKSDTYEGFDANQVFLSIQESPMIWYNVPIIYLKAKKDDSIRKIIGVPKDQKYVTLLDFFTDDFQYKLNPYLEEASNTQIKTGYQKEFLETNQKVNLLSNAIEGRSLKIFPIPDDENNKWISPMEFRTEGYREKIADSTYASFIDSGFNWYLYTLNEAKKKGNFAAADKFLETFKKTQHNIGGAVMLNDDKVHAEIMYNKYDIFKKLFSWYMYAGTLLFVVLIIQIFKLRSKPIHIAVQVLKWSIVGLFVLHTLGLILRWYISGHAPWSDAYESMIYVAWATMFFGLAFGRKSDLTLASTAFVTSMILMIAHWNWMDPAIANLQPVLDSYWLMIHVAVIVASYGPFTLGMILGIVVLFLMILTNEKNKAKMLINIKELTIINEMALTVGLVMLTIGNFLGGQWANESWGRYWGWDPKETWALISIMVYAFVIHMRLVPGLRGRWIFNLMSIVAFASILMTYFGVNFYLAGLHSYASGDQIVSLKFIAIAVAIVAVIGFFSYLKFKKFYKK
ncbi:cytochrome c biogenesis protein [Bizionia paragorgiae]|uniref:Cytochrome c-type biogenesis protein CcsB n=1 Tax=Bizionia paragorgiae TaxID=283786 RepID=A0A1H4C6S7_BIZPA|nr:cytochrome c biogenesis protein CcsA [Bizionia paragorgiae]SEA56111.1 cytochrome c-type biogenesis protein CcsB [Bizionia paragorgiae]